MLPMKTLFKKRKKKASALAKNAKKIRKTQQEQRTDRKKQPLLVKLFYLFIYFGLSVFVIVFFGLWLYAMQLSHEYKLDDGALGGSLWELPSRVYARCGSCPRGFMHARWSYMWASRYH